MSIYLYGGKRGFACRVPRRGVRVANRWGGWDLYALHSWGIWREDVRSGWIRTSLEKTQYISPVEA